METRIERGKVRSGAFYPLEIPVPRLYPPGLSPLENLSNSAYVMTSEDEVSSRPKYVAT